MVTKGHGKGIKKTSTKKSASKRDYQAGRELAIKPKNELKAFDVAQSNTGFAAIAGPPGFPCLNAVVNGAELYQRTGRKIYMKSLHLRGFIRPTGANATSGILRMILFYDSQPNAAAPLIGNLIQDSNAAAATTYDSEINLTNRQRFKILRDYQVYAPATGGADLVSGVLPDPIMNTMNIDWFIKLKGLETIYNGVNGGTIADITSGSIHLVCFSDALAGAWSFRFTSRLRYYD